MTTEHYESLSKMNLTKPKGMRIDCYTMLTREMFAQEGIDFESKHKEISQDNIYKFAHPEEYIKNQSNPIPTISHHIHFTSLANPKGMNKISTDKTIISINRLNEVNNNWKHIFWTNEPSVVRDIARLKNVEVHLIDEFKEHILWEKLNLFISQADTDKRMFSAASNLVRYMALEKFGGVYHDSDYEIFAANKLYILMQVFNFLGGQERNDTYMGNAFVASTSNHPIIKTMISQTLRNLYTERSLLPKYLQYPCTLIDDRMYTTGPVMTHIAVYKSANQDGNNDLFALSSKIFFNKDYIRYVTPDNLCGRPNKPIDPINDFNGTKIETIGADMLCGGWPDSYQELIFYHNKLHNYLAFAAQENDLESLKAYIEYGADINAPCKNGFNSIALAIHYGHKEIVEYLIQKEARLDIVQPNGQTSLSIAISKKNITIIKLLVNAGADVNIADNEGITALHLAVGYNDVEFVNLLILKGANINATMNTGHTPLYLSAFNCRDKITGLLLKAHADTEILVQDQTALYGAIFSGCAKDVALLLAHNANIIWNNLRFMDPLSYASLLKETTPQHKIIGNMVMNHYMKSLDIGLPALTTNNLEAFNVVVVRYKEDLSWIAHEFPNEKVTIYNKGENNLVELPTHYQVINTANVGWFGGTILYHIVTNYEQLSGRTLFLQGNPYDQSLFLPLIRYKANPNSKCSNIIAKCLETTAQVESDRMDKQTKEGWAGTKYSGFDMLDYNMIDFIHRYIDPKYSPNSLLAIAWGAEFAVDASNIHCNNKEYYNNMLTQFQKQFAREDFYLEKSWDIVFACPNATSQYEIIIAGDNGDV